MSMMDVIDSSGAAPQNDAFLIQSTNLNNTNLGTILCCLCGIPIISNPSNMCINCIKSQVDITDGIQKQLIIFYCRNCGRYNAPPYMHIELESKEMLNLCLKKIKGLNNHVKLINAVFIWTEHHSRRIKLQLTIQKEIYINTILQQSFIVEFIIQNLQCTDCQRSFTEHTWKSCVQIRQFVQHKKTFYYLEQLLIKHSYLINNIIEIKENNKNGLDLFYSKRSNSNQLLQFLNHVIPIRSKLSKKLISQDDNSNTYNYKFTIYVEIVPICKYDIVVVDNQKLISKLGHITNQILIVTKVSNLITMLDPLTLKLCEINAKTYYDMPFTSIKQMNELIEYIVLEVEPINTQHNEQYHSVTDMRPFNKQSLSDNNKMQLAIFTVVKASDFGVNDVQYTNIISHLGLYLKVGDSVLGYDMTTANLSEYNIKQSNNIPDIILIKKYYPNAKQRQKQRKFELRQLKKLEKLQINKKSEQEQYDNEYESFIQDIEEDKDMQQKINLYRKSNIVIDHNNINDNTNTNDIDMNDDDDNVDDLPQVDMTQLLDSMDAVQIDEQQYNTTANDIDSDDDDPQYQLAGDDNEDTGFSNTSKRSGTKSNNNNKAKKGKK